MLSINQHIMNSVDLCDSANVIDQLNNEYNNLYDKYKLLEYENNKFKYDKVIVGLNHIIEALEDYNGCVVESSLNINQLDSWGDDGLGLPWSPAIVRLRHELFSP